MDHTSLEFEGKNWKPLTYKYFPALPCLALLCSSVKLFGWSFFLFQSPKTLFTWFCLYICLHKNLNFSITLKLLHCLLLPHQVCESMEYSASVPLDEILSCNESSSLNWWWWLEIWYPSQLFTNSLHSSLILSSSTGVHGLLNIWCQFH